MGRRQQWEDFARQKMVGGANFIPRFHRQQTRQQWLSRLVPATPRGRGPPFKSSQSKLFKPFHVFPSHSRKSDSGIELLQQIGAFSWSVSAVQEFCDSEFAEGNFSWIARIVMLGPQMIGSIFILYSPCLCLLTFALKFSTLYFALSNLLFCRLKGSWGCKKCKDWRKGEASLATSLPAVASSHWLPLKLFAVDFLAWTWKWLC